MSWDLLIPLIEGVSFSLLMIALNTLSDNSRGKSASILSIICWLCLIAGFGAFLIVFSILALMRFPLFPGKIYGVYFLLAGLWLLAVDMAFFLLKIFRQEGSASNLFLKKAMQVLFNPTCLLPRVKLNPVLFKYLPEEPGGLELIPYWQLTVLALFGLLVFLGLALLVYWANYANYSILLVSIVLAVVISLILPRLWRTLGKEGHLIIKQEGLVIPNSRKTCPWTEIQELKIEYGTIKIKKINGQAERIPAIYSISEQDLLEILKNRQAHYINDFPLMDLSSIKGKRWVEHSIVLCALITLPMLAVFYTLAISRLIHKFY